MFLAWMARFTRHTNVTMFSFTSYALVCSKLLSMMVKTRIPWPRTFSFTFQYALETQLLFFVARLLSIHGFLDRFSLVAWRDCDVIVYSLFLFFFFSFLSFFRRRNNNNKRERERTIHEFTHEAIPAQTLPRIRSVRSSFILAPSRCCPTMGPLSSSTPTRSTSLFSIHQCAKKRQPTNRHACDSNVSYLNC